jgi:hypothetical protein
MIHFTLVIIIVTQGAAPPPIQEQPIAQEQPRMPEDPGLIWMRCDQCTWKGGYETLTSAKLGIAGHRTHCKKGRGRKKQLFG